MREMENFALSLELFWNLNIQLLWQKLFIGNRNLDHIISCCIEWNWMEWNWIELNWIELNWVELNGMELNGIELCYITFTLITSYLRWGYMVVDEAHRLKNRSSVLYDSLCALNPRRRLLLTGTPLQNNLGATSD